MTFQYACVAYGKTPLAEIQRADGNFKRIAASLLEKAAFDGKRISLVESKYVFSLLSDVNQMTYICLSDKSIDASVRFYVLDQIKQQWAQKYPNCSGFKANSKDAEFGPELYRLFDSLDNSSMGKIQKIKSNIDAAKDSMEQNLSAAIARSEKLEVMEQKAQDIKESANQFKKGATEVHRAVCCNKWIPIGIAIAAVVVVIVVIIIIYH